MKKCDSWAVAVVYLLEEVEVRAHYTDITKYILETDLTTLGEKGKDPEQTIGSMLRKKYEIFDGGYGDGKYSLLDEDSIRTHKDVQYVYQCLKNKQPKLVYAELEKDNMKLREENRQLRDKLQSIKKLCEEA